MVLNDRTRQSQRSLSASFLRSIFVESAPNYEDGNSCSSRGQIHGMLTALLLIAARIARTRRGAIPLPPRWLWVSLATAAAVRLAAGGAPMLRVGHVEVGCGGLVDVVRLTTLSLVILATSALVTWTTDIADVAPATASWGRWPRAGRCPIEDWSVTVASPLRTLSMLIDERQVVKAVRQLRAKPTPRSRVHQLRLAATAGVGDRGTARMTVNARRADLITLLSVIAVCITAVAGR